MEVNVNKFNIFDLVLTGEHYNTTLQIWSHKLWETLPLTILIEHLIIEKDLLLSSC